MGIGLQSGAWAQAAPAKATKPAAQLIDSIVAVVNDDVITHRELTNRMDIVAKRMKAQKVALPARADFERQMLERMIVERTQVQLAKETGIRVDDAFVDRAIARIAEQNKMSLQDFRNQIEREGTPFASFREEIREEIIMQRVREREVDNKVQISDSEVDNFLAAQANSTQGSQEIDLAQILVRIPENASAEQLAARMARAEQARQQLKNRRRFLRRPPPPIPTRRRLLSGGDLGWRSQERLPQLFNDAIANLKPGEVSQIIRSGNGFHILKLVGKRDASAANATIAPVQQTHARHILIKVNQVVSAADAKRKLTEVKLRLDNKAATFDELAKLY
ncbi:peptidylprolyl isomerase [Undibacterium arcticum]